MSADYNYLGRPVRSDYDGEVHWSVWRSDGGVVAGWAEYCSDGDKVVLEHGDTIVTLGRVRYGDDYEHRVWEVVYRDAQRRFGVRKALSEPQPPIDRQTREALTEATHASYPQPQIQPPADAMRLGDIAPHVGEGIGVSTLRSYLSRHQMPDPDGYWGPWPWFLPATIERWLAGRPGRGNRTPRKATAI